MAYVTTDKYKSFIYSEESEQVVRLIINGKEINTDYVRSLKNKDEIFEKDFFTLGSAIPEVYELELDNDLVEELGEFSEITFEFDLIYNSLEKETIPLKTFLVKKNPSKSDNYTKYTLYDYMDKFDKEIDFSEIVPCTRFRLLQHLCEKCGVELENKSIVNGDVLVAVYDNTIKAKTYLSLISERAGGFAKINRNNKLVIKSFNEVNTVELPSTKLGAFDKDEVKTISKVIYENATQKFEAGTDDGITVFLSSDSPFTCLQSEVDNIYQVINGLQFQSVDLQIWGDPSIDTGDIISCNGMRSFAQKDWIFGNGFYGNYKAKLEKSDKKSNVEKLPMSAKIKKVQTKLDEESGKIDLLTQTTEANKTELANITMQTDKIESSVQEIQNDNEENYNKIVQDIQKLLISMQNTGGSNLIKNSVMFAYDSNKIPNDWEISENGTIDMQSSAEALNCGSLSGHVFILKDKTVKQRIYVKPDNSSIPEDEKTYYTFSTKIKKKATGTCYIKLSNTNEEYLIELKANQDSFYGDYEIKGLLPSLNYYDIEFYGSEESEATFTDNMFSVGRYKSQWTQANGEIMNTQININLDGILVKSVVYAGDYTVMSPLEFAGYSKINGVITKVFTLNKDTTFVMKLEAKDEIKMYPIKTVPITEGEIQGWAYVPTSKGGSY